MNKLIPVEFKNQRIMTTKILAEEFGTEEKNIQMNFSNNIGRFKEGKHFIELKGQALKDFKNSLPNEIGEPLKFAPKLILWTDRGVARHAKILDTDEAWEVYENLEENYFNPKKLRLLTAKEELKLHYEVLEDHEEKINKIDTKIDNLENNMPLFNVECKELQALVRKKGIEVLGGKGSQAYKDNSLRGKVYSDIQQQLRREFQITRYEAIKRCQLNIAKEIVKMYKAPLVISDEIIKINNQLNFEEVI